MHGSTFRAWGIGLTCVALSFLATPLEAGPGGRGGPGGPRGGGGGGARGGPSGGGIRSGGGPAGGAIRSSGGPSGGIGGASRGPSGGIAGPGGPVRSSMPSGNVTPGRGGIAGPGGPVRSSMPTGNLTPGGTSRGSAIVNTPTRSSSLPGNLGSASNATRHSVPSNTLTPRSRDAAKIASVSNHPARAAIGSAAAVGTLHQGHGWYYNGWCNRGSWYGWGSRCHSHLSIGFGFYPGLFVGWGNPWLDCLWGYSLTYPSCGSFYAPLYYPEYDVIQPLTPTGPERLPNMPKEANVQVILPDAGIVVWLDDHRTMSTGRDRQYATPPLQPGKKYTYKVIALWERDGEVLQEERKVAVVAGQTTVVDFTATATAARDGK